MRKIWAALGAAVLLAVVGCSAQPETDEQRDCLIADELLPTLRGVHSGEISGEELTAANEEIHEALYSKMVELGQANAMVFVLSDADSDEQFADFERQLVEYCEGFADWEMKNG